MKTPEGYLRVEVDKFLATLRHCYVFSPVQMGMGKRTLDRLCCINGRFVAVELKAPGKKPTKLQEQCAKEIERAGGVAFCCDSFEGFIMGLKLNGLIPQFEGDPRFPDRRYMTKQEIAADKSNIR